MEESKIKPATITGKEAAKYIGISYWLVLDLAKKGKIPCIKAGDRYLFRKETLDRWMQDQEAESIQPVDMNNVGIGKIRRINA